MVADRLADTVTVLLIAVVTFFLASDAIIEFLEENMSSYVAIGHLLTSPWLWGAGLVFILAFCILMKCKTEAAWILKMRQVVKELWLGFIGIVTMKGKGMWLLLTIGIWGCFTIQMYVCFLAFPFTRELVAENGWIVAQVAFVLGSISMGVPSNGGIGPWQWAVIFALGIYGLGRAEGAAFANLVLGTQTLMLILLGIFTFTAIAIDKRRRARLSGGETAVDGQEATGDEGGIF